METSIGRALLLAFLTAVLGFLGGNHYADLKAEARESDAAKVAAQDSQKAAEALNTANAKNRKQEQDFALEVQALAKKFQKENEDARAADATTIANYKLGASRMRLQVTKCQAGSAGSAQADGAPGGSDGTATAELAPATAAALYGIAADGDTAIRKLTLLQDWASGAMKLCNGSSP